MLGVGWTFSFFWFFLVSKRVEFPQKLGLFLGSVVCACTWEVLNVGLRGESGRMSLGSRQLG